MSPKRINEVNIVITTFLVDNGWQWLTMVPHQITDFSSNQPPLLSSGNWMLCQLDGAEWNCYFKVFVLIHKDNLHIFYILTPMQMFLHRPTFNWKEHNFNILFVFIFRVVNYVPMFIFCFSRGGNDCLFHCQVAREIKEIWVELWLKTCYGVWLYALCSI